MCIFFTFESTWGFKSPENLELGIDNHRDTTNSELLPQFLCYCAWASEVRR
jgi:hypothetical protein